MADDSSGDAGGGTVRDVTASAIDWEAVRHDFLYSGMAQRRIAWKHGTGDDTVRKRKRAEGWVRVVPVERLPTRRSTGPRDGEPPTPTQKRRAGLIRRLFAVLTDLCLRILPAPRVRTF